MSLVQQIVELFKQLFSWWFIVEPWEQSVRTRCGKHVRLFEAGIYFRIPFIDTVYTQNIRRRICNVPVQTLTTSDGKSITVYGSLGYRIHDVLLLQRTLHDAEMSVHQEALGLVSGYVALMPLDMCTPEMITKYVNHNLKLTKYGLGDVEYFLTGYVADVPIYRLLQDSLSAYYGGGGTLSTVAAPPK